MKRGTKIGWALVAVSIVLSIWVIAGGSSEANQTTPEGLILSDDGTTLVGVATSATLGSVSIPDTVTTISSGAFSNQANMTNVTMGDQVTSIGSGAFQGCGQLQSVRLSSQLTAIPADMFRGCESLLSIDIPGTVTSIGNNAFYDCLSLNTVAIPASVTTMAMDAFRDCSSLTAINVSGANTQYRSVDGVVYNASGSRLLLAPEGKTSVTIASGTTVLASNSFAGCRDLNALTIPQGVTTIEANAFDGSGIETVTIPASVTTIASQGSWRATTIYGYADSEAETYAKNTNTPFIVVGNSGNAGASDEESTPNDNGGTNPDNNGGTTPDNNGGTTPDNNGGTTPDNNGGTTPDNNGGTTPNTNGGNVIPNGDNSNASVGTTNSNISGAPNGATSNNHEKDATPNTAGGFDPRYLLCIAALLGGVGIIVNSKRNRADYISKRKQR